MPKHYKRWILITGATDGLGRQLAQELAANTEENFVIVHGRSARKCEEFVSMLAAENCHNGRERVNNSSSSTPVNVDFVAADFSKLVEVKFLRKNS